MFDVGVDLSRLDAGVAKHLLNQPKVSTTGQQVSRKAVPQAMRTDFAIDANTFGVVFDHSPKLNAINRSTATRKK